MLPTTQPSVKRFFSTLTNNQYQSLELPRLANSTPLSVEPPPLTKDAKKEILNAQKKQNMKDLRNRQKAKDIIQGKQDSEGNIIKEKPNAFHVLNQAEGGLHSYWLDIASTTNHSCPLAKRARLEGLDVAESLTNDGENILVRDRSRKNWFHPHIWPAIDMAAKRTHFSPRETISYLQSCYQDTGLYDGLYPLTFCNWIDKSTATRTWLPRVEEAVTQATYWNPIRQYRSILDGKTKLIDKIKETLLAIRQASLTVNANLARAIILGYIQSDCPELLGEGASYKPRGGVPIFSLSTTRQFLYNHLGWSSRRGTKDG